MPRFQSNVGCPDCGAEPEARADSAETANPKDVGPTCKRGLGAAAHLKLVVVVETWEWGLAATVGNLVDLDWNGRGIRAAMPPHSESRPTEEFGPAPDLQAN